ncbi:MAG: hypothetical protein QF773_07695 [Lentisphaeria bacterium]|nr:hypothetical protein [Lentisphaeria bacterium]
MKLSLFTVFFAGLRGPPALTLEALVDKAAELGYTGAELMDKCPHFSPLDWSLSTVRDCTSNWQAAISSVTPRAWSKT